MSIYYLYPPPSRYPTTSIRGHAFPAPGAHAGGGAGAGSNPLHPLLHVLHDLAHPGAAAHDVRAPHVDIRETAARYDLDVELPGVAAGDYSVRWTDRDGGGDVLLVEAEVRRRRVPEEEEEEAEEEEVADGSSLHRVRSHDGDDLYVTVSSGSDEDEHDPRPVPPVTPAKKARTQSLSAAWTAAAARPRAFLLRHAATLPAHPEEEEAVSSSSSHHSRTPKRQPPPPDADPNHHQPPPRVRSLARERRVGTFARAFRFHGAVERAGLRARLEQGVLSVVVPKKEEARAKEEGRKTGKGVEAMAVKRRRRSGSEQPPPQEPEAAAKDKKNGGGGRSSLLHGPHHWTLAWPGPARNRVVGPRDWSPGLMNSPGFFM